VVVKKRLVVVLHRTRGERLHGGALTGNALIVCAVEGCREVCLGFGATKCSCGCKKEKIRKWLAIRHSGMQ
jgi:hypothetical protein